MPALFALAQHGALVATQRQLQPGERLLAFMDDICADTSPDRARPVFDACLLSFRRTAGSGCTLERLMFGTPLAVSLSKSGR